MVKAKSNILVRTAAALVMAPLVIAVLYFGYPYVVLLLAGVGAGIYPDAPSAVRQCLTISRRIEPDPELSARYAGLFQTYRAIHDALAPVYRGMN